LKKGLHSCSLWWFYPIWRINY